jgi:hypothetical protein
MRAIVALTWSAVISPVHSNARDVPPWRGQYLRRRHVSDAAVAGGLLRGLVSSLTNAFVFYVSDERNRCTRQFICKGRRHRSRRPFALRTRAGLSLHRRQLTMPQPLFERLGGRDVQPPGTRGRRSPPGGCRGFPGAGPRGGFAIAQHTVGRINGSFAAQPEIAPCFLDEPLSTATRLKGRVHFRSPALGVAGRLPRR